ncbi:putative DNA base hypermodification protein [Mesorhizobium sp. M0955]|uniref:nucleotide kinase domain-containing protein n=1 Tax=Mesorhizobium sp. M0955 TaxID=2957033 RepID=UPI00333933E9
MSEHMEPTPVFDSYWRFAAERQAMFFRRIADPIGPWTTDPILGAFRFTNAYRASDRVSQYLIRQIQYHPDRPSTPTELFFRTMLFKFFNRIETWEALERKLGPLTWKGTDLDAVSHVLDQMMGRGQRIYSAAYIMPAPALGKARKHANHLALLVQMMSDKLPDRLRQAATFRTVYEQLLRYPGIGPFLAFQYAIDLNYSMLLEHSEADFVIAGPGARDGIAKCFVHTEGRDAEAVIHWVCDQQERAFEASEIGFQTLYGRRLQPIDCQNLFCEISKYARVAHPDVAGISGRTRIKQAYRHDPEPLPTPFYPPRWGLNIVEVERTSTRGAKRFEMGLFA